MKLTRLSLILVMLVSMTGLLVGQQFFPEPQASSYFNGIAYAPNFGMWQARLSADIASSATVLVVDRGFVTTPDGITFVPFVANEKIILGSGTSVAEIVSVSSVSGCTLASPPGSTATCTVTLGSGTTNAHSARESISSGDYGIMEAIGFMSNVGGGQVYWKIDCGQITLNTGGLTTTSTCFVPTTFYSQGVAARVTSTITVTASWALGISGSTAAFSSANSHLDCRNHCFGKPSISRSRRNHQ
jgi:hypothetical protein